ncbi:hypothetical protein OCF84_21560 (plasmid) [Shewanella xiamenensis]|uniref:Uncharacterized protein n=1 Tax=Shewanella xiamenensis TaxID=332186 RepID=A0ABT6UDI3_9GAMM|nr:hypothetical protein [Shewanella xiamenensis]MDI5832535.1 hypothetical protein [Shewanella xiamenensis]WHF57847.1 hypothetical protein OCF84_21560 [Shewanella xiamenensis]
MSNHIVGNLFLSVAKMARMSNKQLAEIANNKKYRESTRQNARVTLTDCQAN